MDHKRYRVVIAQSGKTDVKEKKQYILRKFKYRAYANNFSNRIKLAAKQLDTFPQGYGTTGFSYRGYDIYLKPAENHLLFYTIDDSKLVVTVLRVLQDGMDWEYIIREWLERHDNR